MLCFSIVLSLRKLAKVGPKNGSCEGSAVQDVYKICATPARESDLEVKIVKNWRCRSTFGSSHRQNLHHACARERFGSQNRWKLACREHFWKLTSTKFAPRLRARAIWKSKSLKRGRLGALLEVQLRKICTTPARANDSEVKIVKTPGARDVFGGWKCVSRGRRRDCDTLQNTRQAQEFVRVAKTLAGVVDLKRLRNDAFRVAGAVISRFVMSMFEASDAESVEGLQISGHGSVALQWSFRVAVTGVRMASAQLFRGRRSTFEASNCKSLKRIVILRSSVWSTCHFWRKSRRKASFLSFKASILKEVSQKCFVFDLQSFIFEGSLAEMLRFWSSKLHFWRKSRRKASFLIFKASFLKDVSHKRFVFELQSFNLEGSLAELLPFWFSKLDFRRKSRTKASFLSFKASFLKEVSHKSVVFELQSFNFEGSLAEKLRFWASKFQFWRKSPRKALNLKSIDNQITWISDQLTTNSL